MDRARVCVAGESGGGNLTIASALRCVRDGTAAELMPMGFYALCPYIAGIWPQDTTNSGVLGRSHLDSESNGYFIRLPGNTNVLRIAQV